MNYYLQDAKKKQQKNKKTKKTCTILSNNDYLPLIYGHVYKTFNKIKKQYFQCKPCTSNKIVYS